MTQAPVNRTLLYAAGLVFLALAAYSNSFYGGFTLDSEPLIVNDPRLQEVSAEHLRQIFVKSYWYPQPDTSVYRPLVKLAWLVDYSVLGGGREPLLYHATNLAWHLLNTMLLWRLLLALTRRPLAAVLAAAVFAAHPIATEAVTNLAGLPDLMTTAFVFAGLLCHIEEGSARWKLPALFALSAAAVASKESGFTLLPAMLLYDVTLRVRSLADAARRAPAYAAAFAGALAVFLLREMALSHLRPPITQFVDNPLLGFGFWGSRVAALEIVLRYLQLLVWPGVLSCDYSYNQIQPLTPWLKALTIGAWAAILCLLALAWRRNRTLFFFAVFFLLALFPVSNLTVQIGSIMAERFVYLPLAGFIGCLAVASQAWPRPGAAALAAFALALGVRTYVRNFDWQDNLSLWRAAAQASPNSFKPHWVYGNSLVRTGGDTRLPEAIQEEERAVAILDTLPPDRGTSIPYAMLGHLWLIQGDHLRPRDPEGGREADRAAARVFAKGVPVDRACNDLRHRADRAGGWQPGAFPDDGVPLLYSGLAQALSRLDRYPEAVAPASYAVHLSPGDSSLYAILAAVQRKSGKEDDAIRSYAQAYLLGKDSAQLAGFRDLFQHLHPGACPAESAESLNLECPEVRTAICESERSLVQSFGQTVHRELVEPYEASKVTGRACYTSGDRR